ncbi:MAG TPA: hypothetical protein VH369_22260 [Bryobacteraceae bacterium]|jgi:hypothetical protein
MAETNVIGKEKRQFTPGPWAVEPDTDGRYVIAETEFWFIVTNSPYDDEEAEGNAALIAAAPELYEAATTALGWLEEYRDSIVDAATYNGDDGKPDLETLDENVRDDVNGLDEAIGSLRAAITKAEGP